MLTLVYQPNRLQQFVQAIAGSTWGAWLFARLLHHLDRPVLRLSHGRYSVSSLATGLPIVTVTTIGAKSGQPRSLPLIAIPAEEKVILIASNFGQKHHPAWYYNLRAHPEAQLTYERKTVSYAACETVGEERERYWQRAVEVYPGYVAYRERADQRTIGVFLLTPQTK